MFPWDRSIFQVAQRYDLTGSQWELAVAQWQLATARWRLAR